MFNFKKAIIMIITSMFLFGCSDNDIKLSEIVEAEKSVDTSEKEDEHWLILNVKEMESVVSNFKKSVSGDISSEESDRLLEEINNSIENMKKITPDEEEDYIEKLNKMQQMFKEDVITGENLASSEKITQWIDDYYNLKNEIGNYYIDKLESEIENNKLRIEIAKMIKDELSKEEGEAQ